jgi:GNAT superfamily N-acetyltransferase
MRATLVPVLETATPPRSDSVTVRRELRPGDVEALVRMHAAIYEGEYRLGGSFAPDVARDLEAAIERGWPQRGGVWIVEAGGEVAGSLALTEEPGAPARVRWFLLAPEVRGLGLGRRLLAELVAEADEAGHRVLCLVTFSELRTAARLYRSHGFEVTDSHEDDRWGRPLLLQRYERRRP